jgi:hypothetical protein
VESIWIGRGTEKYCTRRLNGTRFAITSTVSVAVVFVIVTIISHLTFIHS